MATTAPVQAILAPEVERRLRALADRWAHVGAAERANYQLYLIELAEAIGVERPRPAPQGGRVAEAAPYHFEYPVQATTRDGATTTNFIDLYKQGCFALEAKDAVDGSSNLRMLTGAFGQVSNYAKDLSERPPYIMVLDVGKTLIVWDRWAGTYGGFNAGRRIDLRTLVDRPEDVALLRDIWTDPALRDPRRHAQAVTEEIAALLAELAATLERRGHDQERVARFLIRCVFTMFAEDVHLLPDASFKRLLEAVQPSGPGGFVAAAEALWRAMDQGALFGYHKLLRFNGHFFRDAEALPLDAEELALLRRAAGADWSAVEPTIFGTLLVRALTPEERHRLGAEYTPRAFIERLVRPTVEEPVRERWAAVQAEVLQLRERGRPVDLRTAEARLVEFHDSLLGLQILDPACGSGNFLYVTMHSLKRVEVEVFRLLADLHGGQLGARLAEIDPGQFHGIEVKAWAREIAELTLWIGYHQFWRQHHDVQPDEPLLRDTGTLEHRDAVLAWDAIRHDPARDRPDPTPRITSPVTGQLVPDPEARLPYMEYVDPQPAEWPEVDFIVGNPPYLGNKRMREAFGDGYVDALRAAYPELPDSIDYVMYWWVRAAEAVASGRTTRAGLITTNSITQHFHQPLVAQAADMGAHVVWAAPDHPWQDASDAAAVRVAMTVLARDAAHAARVDVDGTGTITRVVEASRLNADLTAGADVVHASSVPLRANERLSFRGFAPVGAGFILERPEAEELLRMDARHADIIRPFRHGKCLTARPRDEFIIDFGTRTEDEARRYPVLYDIVRTRVKPEREAKADPGRKRYWWRFGRTNSELRAGVTGLPRYLATPYVARRRFFTFLEPEIAPDDKIVVIAMDDAFHLGVLSSAIHVAWADAAGTRLGVGNDSTYNNPRCFDAFPFPDPQPTRRAVIADRGAAIDSHRKTALARDSRVTMTAMYNVVEKLRTGEPLSAPEQAVHTLAACGVLRDLHDELDRLVAEAYGWQWPLSRDEILDRLVALHDERVAEEAAGTVRWLRPAFQAPRGAAPLATREEELPLQETKAPTKGGPRPWPDSAVEQIAALKELVARQPSTADEAVTQFKGARRELVVRHLETLAILGEVRVTEGGRYSAAAAY